MKFKLTANADIDLLTKGELTDVLDEYSKNWKREFHLRDIDGSTLNIPANGSAPLGGPTTGMTWEVKRISVVGSAVDIYRNTTTPSGYRDSIQPGMKTYSARTLIVKSGGILLAANPTGSAITTVVNLCVTEVPSHLEWTL